MGSRLKSYSLVVCLFVFLFVVIGAGLHLNPIGAFAAALSGTPLVVFGMNRWTGVRSRIADVQEKSKHTIYGFDPFVVCANCGEVYARHGNENCPTIQTDGGKATSFRAIR